jgi:hypothetical protein
MTADNEYVELDLVVAADGSIPADQLKRLGVRPGAHLRVLEADMTGPDGGFVPAHLEDRDGWTVIVPDEPVPPLTTEMVREVLEHVRK